MLGLTLLVSLLFGVVAAQNCYVPNGQTPLDPQGACGSNAGAACCQLGWQCLSNGLCYLPAENYYTRSGCTDKDWKSPSCLKYCMTDNGSGGGNQAVNKCSNGKYCCNADRLHGDCCTKSGTTFFELPAGRVIASITSAAATSPISSRTSSASTSSQSDASTTTDASTSTTIVTSLITSVATNSAGTSIILVTSAVTNTIPPTSAPQGGGDDSGSSSKTGVIVGCAVGIPVGLALVGLLAFFLWRRRRQAQASSSSEKPAIDSPPDSTLLRPRQFYTGKPLGGVAEIDGHQRRPMSEIDGTPVNRPKIVTSFADPTSTVPAAAATAAPTGASTAPNGPAQGHYPSNSWSSATSMHPPANGQNQYSLVTPVSAGPDATGGLGLSPLAATGPGLSSQSNNVVSTPGGRYIPYRPPNAGGPPPQQPPAPPVELP